jgi:hypothetical protein
VPLVTLQYSCLHALRGHRCLTVHSLFNLKHLFNVDIHQHRILGGFSVESLPLTPVTLHLFTSYFSLCADLAGCRTVTTANLSIGPPGRFQRKKQCMCSSEEERARPVQSIKYCQVLSRKRRGNTWEEQTRSTRSRC